MQINNSLTSNVRADVAEQNLRMENLTEECIRNGINTNPKIQRELGIGRRGVCNILRRLKARGAVFYSRGTNTWAIKLS